VANIQVHSRLNGYSLKMLPSPRFKTVVILNYNNKDLIYIT